MTIEKKIFTRISMKLIIYSNSTIYFQCTIMKLSSNNKPVCKNQTRKLYLYIKPKCKAPKNRNHSYVLCRGITCLFLQQTVANLAMFSQDASSVALPVIKYSLAYGIKWILLRSEYPEPYAVLKLPSDTHQNLLAFPPSQKVLCFCPKWRMAFFMWGINMVPITGHLATQKPLLTETTLAVNFVLY